jgi:hypothetical protein
MIKEDLGTIKYPRDFSRKDIRELHRTEADPASPVHTEKAGARKLVRRIFSWRPIFSSSSSSSYSFFFFFLLSMHRLLFCSRRYEKLFQGLFS